MKTLKNKKYTVKIPDKINIFYSKEKKILIIKGPITQKSLKIENKIKIKENKIEVTSLSLSKTRNNLLKKLKEKQGTIVAIIKQLMTDTSAISYRKLNFVGIGYRASSIENHLFLLKLGFSHPIYFKMPVNMKISCIKLTKIILRGNSYQSVMTYASKIRSKKLPEPYKGKGILYSNEKIKIKEGKKI